MEALAQLRYKNEGAQNNSSPYDLGFTGGIFMEDYTPYKQIGWFHANVYANM